MSLRKYIYAAYVLMTVLLAGLLLFGSFETFVFVYIAVFTFVTLRTLATPSTKILRSYLILSHLIVLALQLIFCVQVVFAENPSYFAQPFRRLTGVILVLLPLAVSRYISVGKYSQFYLPSLQDIKTVSFAELRDSSVGITSAFQRLDTARRKLSGDNIRSIMEDLPRHDSFRYINNGSLTPAYFQAARESLNDPFLYIIISSTGSPASEMISIFTRKKYNHASLSFDRDLKTIISYNGGERVYPPGLNHEMLEFFDKKENASIMIYKLPCTHEQKKTVLKKVEEINREGSAYNVMGLVVKYSHKPNIMYCSQFVYQMLELAGLTYFEKKNGKVRPTDLVELDYHRQLLFDCEIYFS